MVLISSITVYSLIYTQFKTSYKTIKSNKAIYTEIYIYIYITNYTTLYHTYPLLYYKGYIHIIYNPTMIKVQTKKYSKKSNK